MSVNTVIHGVKSVSVASFTPWNNSAFTIEIHHGDSSPVEITFFGSPDFMQRMVGMFGDESTREHTNDKP